MHNTIIIRYGEIALKGGNRVIFEKRLVSNVRSFLKNNKIRYDSITRNRGRILISTKEKSSCLHRVFGIISFSYAVKTKADIKEISNQCLKLAANNLDKRKTFKIDTNRADKRFKFNSLDVNRVVGKLIQDKTQAEVKLKNPDLTISIEIADHAYIFTSSNTCPGGLPIGVEGQAYALIEDNNSILAAILAMKRGCSIFPVAYKEINIDLLKKFDPNIKLKIIKNIGDIDANIPLITGQTLGGVKKPNNSLILRPLIAFDTQNINEKLDFYSKL
jgi:thiamine biosynthesis protein ThiI|tara:strand:- start:282 stop:1103 length:822 start_codon:yes stop_codon:yes gene_type:complete